MQRIVRAHCGVCTRKRHVRSVIRRGTNVTMCAECYERHATPSIEACHFCGGPRPAKSRHFLRKGPSVYRPACAECYDQHAQPGRRTALIPGIVAGAVLKLGELTVILTHTGKKQSGKLPTRVRAITIDEHGETRTRFVWIEDLLKHNPSLSRDARAHDVDVINNIAPLEA